MLDSSLRGCGFKPQGRHCVVSLSKNINPSLVLDQPMKTRPFITERLLMGHKESNKLCKPLVVLKFLYMHRLYHSQTLLHAKSNTKGYREKVPCQWTKIFQYCTCPAGRVTYNFLLSCKHMHLSFKSVSNKNIRE